MVNHHGAQSGFHPPPPRRQPLCSGGASQEQPWTHTQPGQRGQVRAVPRQARPPGTVQGGHATRLVVPPPWAGSLGQGSSKGSFSPCWRWVSSHKPVAVRASHPVGTPCQYGTATRGRVKRTRARQHALDHQGGYHRGEDKDVPRDTTASTHILDPHPAAGPEHTPPAQ